MNSLVCDYCAWIHEGHYKYILTGACVVLLVVNFKALCY